MHKVRRGYFILLIIGLLILFGCGEQGYGLPHGEEDGMIYQGQCFWFAEEFSGLSEDDLMELFQEKYDVDARDFNFTFNETDHSAVIECHVYGQVSKSGNNYRANFSWLLTPLGLDFIADNFSESKAGLSWEGTVDGVPTTIRIECPAQDLVYKAWQQPVGHCHAHTWWPASIRSLVKCIEIRGKNDNYHSL